MLLALKMQEFPQAKECRWLLEAGKGKETDYSLEPPERNSPGDALLLAQQEPVLLPSHRTRRYSVFAV